MEYIPENPILEFHDDTLEAVRRSYNLHRPGEMSNVVDILEDWVSKQSHFTRRNFSRDYLERLILHSKGSVERAKARLDKLCTMRTLLPHAFIVMNVKTDFNEYEDIMQGSWALLPKLTKDHFRVAILRHRGQKFTRKFSTNIARLSFIVAEYVQAYDYVKGYILLIDIIGFNVSEALSAVNVTEIKESIDLYRGSMDNRLKSIHIISTSKVIDVGVNLFKQFVSPKLANRFHVHTSIETVHNFIDKEILPVEYGGLERPLADLHKRCIDVLSSKKTIEHLKNIRKARTDESKRSRDTFNDLYMGVSGTFRNLIVD